MDKQTGRESSGDGDSKWAAQLEAELGVQLRREGDVLDLEPHANRPVASQVGDKSRGRQLAAPTVRRATRAPEQSSEPDPQEMLSLLEALGI